MAIDIQTPISDEVIAALRVGDMVTITGYIYAGRDRALPKLVRMIEDGEIENSDIQLQGSVVFHTAVSPAGVGPTSSNKVEIESSFRTLSKEGVKLYLGKGEISEITIAFLEENNAVYAVIPPVTALLRSKTLEQKVVAFPEEGIEALHVLKVLKIPAIIAVAHGLTIREDNN